jgi:hypothetical protein
LSNDLVSLGQAFGMLDKLFEVEHFPAQGRFAHPDGRLHMFGHPA